MAEKNGTVIGIEKGQDWDGRDGKMYKFILEMDNGDKGEYNSSKFQNISDLKFKQGEAIDYEFIPGDHPKIKPIFGNKNSSYNKPSNGNSRSVHLPSVAIRMAVDLVVGDQVNIKHLKSQAKGILDWLKEND